MLAGCSGLNKPTAQVLAAPKRDLEPNEKLALSPLFATKLKDPTAALFKWMPVVLVEREGVTDYCGLVNGRNSYGGYTGEQVWVVTLQGERWKSFSEEGVSGPALIEVRNSVRRECNSI